MHQVRRYIAQASRPVPRVRRTGGPRAYPVSQHSRTYREHGCRTGKLTVNSQEGAERSSSLFMAVYPLIPGTTTQSENCIPEYGAMVDRPEPTVPARRLSVTSLFRSNPRLASGRNGTSAAEDPSGSTIGYLPDAAHACVAAGPDRSPPPNVPRSRIRDGAVEFGRHGFRPSMSTAGPGPGRRCGTTASRYRRIATAAESFGAVAAQGEAGSAVAVAECAGEPRPHGRAYRCRRRARGASPAPLGTASRGVSEPPHPLVTNPTKHSSGCGHMRLEIRDGPWPSPRMRNICTVRSAEAKLMCGESRFLRSQPGSRTVDPTRRPHDRHAGPRRPRPHTLLHR